MYIIMSETARTKNFRLAVPLAFESNSVSPIFLIQSQNPEPVRSYFETVVFSIEECLTLSFITIVWTPQQAIVLTLHHKAHALSGYISLPLQFSTEMTQCKCITGLVMTQSQADGQMLRLIADT